MGGHIEVTSVPGGGATFTVDLPFATPSTAAQLGAAWPRPHEGERVLIVLDGAIEAALAGDLLIAMGASVARARADEAEQLARSAADSGMPFSALLTDKANAEAGASRLIPLLSPCLDGRAPRAVVTIDPSERGDIARFRAEGFNGYLVRPVRPVSALTQLLGYCPAQRLRGVASAEPHAVPAVNLDTAKGLSVLLAEDNDINALLARTVLEKSGAYVMHARDGAEAIAKAHDALVQGEGFDLVLMDIHMPDMDGVEAARGIRALYPDDARPGAGRPPVVALTANAFAEDRAAYLAAGLDDYLAKPFEKQDLDRLLAHWRGEDKGGREETGAGAA